MTHHSSVTLSTPLTDCIVCDTLFSVEIIAPKLVKNSLAAMVSTTKCQAVFLTKEDP